MCSLLENYRGKHADVQVVALNQNGSEDTKEKTEIGIDQIKDMLRSASLPPFEGKYRVYIIDEAGQSLDGSGQPPVKDPGRAGRQSTFYLINRQCPI